MKILSAPFEMENRKCVILDYTDSGYNYEELPDVFGVLKKEPELHRKAWLLEQMKYLLGEGRAPNGKSGTYKHNNRTPEQNTAEKGFIFNESKILFLIEYLGLTYNQYKIIFVNNVIIQNFTVIMSEDEFSTNRTYFTRIMSKKYPDIKKVIKPEWRKQKNCIDKEIPTNDIKKRLQSNRLCALYKNFVDTNHILLGLFGKEWPSIDTWVKGAEKALRDEENYKKQ
jgi:hypothetical protein